MRQRIKNNATIPCCYPLIRINYFFVYFKSSNDLKFMQDSSVNSNLQ